MPIDAERLLLEHLDTVERVVAFTCRRNGVAGADAEDFASTVKLRLVENDYAILRKFQGRSSFATFISIVIQRMLLDERVHTWGKWHPSAAARRMGEGAVALEKLLHRDHRSMDEAFAILSRTATPLNRRELEELAERLPERAARPRAVELEHAAPLAAAGEDAEQLAMKGDRRRISQRISTVMRSVMRDLPRDDQLILQLRFECGMTVARIARSLQIDQKLLYRRIEQRIREIRKALSAAGVEAGDALDLIGRHGVELGFGLENLPTDPSIPIDRADIAAQKEISG